MTEKERKPLKLSKHKIFHDFRRGVFYEEIYEKYNITEKGLIRVLQMNIKGNYDYKRILSGGTW